MAFLRFAIGGPTEDINQYNTSTREIADHVFARLSVIELELSWVARRLNNDDHEICDMHTTSFFWILMKRYFDQFSKQ